MEIASTFTATDARCWLQDMKTQRRESASRENGLDCVQKPQNRKLGPDPVRDKRFSRTPSLTSSAVQNLFFRTAVSEQALRGVISPSTMTGGRSAAYYSAAMRNPMAKRKRGLFHVDSGNHPPPRDTSQRELC